MKITEEQIDAACGAYVGKGGTLREVMRAVIAAALTSNKAAAVAVDDTEAHIKWLHFCLRDAGYCIDGGKCHHDCKQPRGACWRKDEGACVPLSGSKLNDDWTLSTPPAPIASSSEAEPVARITSADEYGPILVWSTHWVDLIGRNLFTHPAAAQPSRAEVLTKLRAAQMCHPNAVQPLIEEAIDLLEEKP